MIASLHGLVVDITLTSAVIECGGVGYQFLAAPHTLGSLTRGEESTVLTTQVVREDAITLYGFSDAASREIFVTLQKVSGVGPRVALAALSVASPDDLVRAILSGDHKFLQRIPSVGKRLAERIVVDLKDKMPSYTVIAENDENRDDHAHVQNPHEIRLSTAEEDIVCEALIGLGFSEREARGAIAAAVDHNSDVSHTWGTSELLRSALAMVKK